MMPSCSVPISTGISTSQVKEAYFFFKKIIVSAAVSYSDGESAISSTDNGDIIIVVVSAKIGEQYASDFIVRTKMPNFRYFGKNSHHSNIK